MAFRFIAPVFVLTAALGVLLVVSLQPAVPPGRSRSAADSETHRAADQRPEADESAQTGHSFEPPLVKEEPAETPEGMVWIPGGTFVMGDREGAPDKDPEYADQIPEHRDAMYEHQVALDGFWMDATEVTNREFLEFVEATGYVTKAEKGYTKEDYADQVADLSQINEEFLQPGSVCFNSDFDPKNLKGFNRKNPAWVYMSGIWKIQNGADWRHPDGPDSSIEGRMDHPVVHVTWHDAMAYCKWAGKTLPTEAQWEYAARGGLEGKNYPWGDEIKPDGRWSHNIWQGEFPYENKVEDGFRKSAPVGSFPPNGYGLHDMTGNVWEWCRDWYRPDYYLISPLRNPQGPDKGLDPTEPQIPKRVQRGGSFMCSDTYCIGYSVASRMPGDPNSGAFHTGFRCVVTPDKLDEYTNAPAREGDDSSNPSD